MAYLMRSLAVIGIIAFHSPVHSSRSTDGDSREPGLAKAAGVAGQIDARRIAGSITAAREAADIVAGLDPETRARLIAMTTATLAARHDAKARDVSVAGSR